MSHLTSPLRRALDPGTRTAVPQTEISPMNEPSVRSSAMLLMHEELARARMSELRDEAENYRRCARLLAARRWQRKAEQAARRARQAQNSVW